MVYTQFVLLIIIFGGKNINTSFDIQDARSQMK